MKNEILKLKRRLAIAERTCWIMADECFQKHMQPEGYTQTEFVSKSRNQAIFIQNELEKSVAGLKGGDKNDG